MNLPECGLPKTHKEIVRIMVFSIPCLKDGQATSNTKSRAPLPGFSRVIWDEWGKKGVRMDTKALKKQMGAAIAMVLVAAVASAPPPSHGLSATTRSMLRPVSFLLSRTLRSCISVMKKSSLRIFAR